MNNEIILNRKIEDRGLRTAMSLKQKFRPYSVLVVLRTSASPGFNDQVKIPASENLTSGEFSVVLSVRRFRNVEDEVYYFLYFKCHADGCIYSRCMPVCNRYENWV